MPSPKGVVSMWQFKPIAFLTYAVVVTCLYGVAKGAFQTVRSEQSSLNYHIAGSKARTHLCGLSAEDLRRPNLISSYFPSETRYEVGTSWTCSISSHDRQDSAVQYATDSNTWRGITPLSSGRAEVEKLLGAPTKSVGKTSIYESKSEKVDVVYSKSACEATETGKWNVPRDTVVKLRIYPQEIVLIKDLHLSGTKYTRVVDAHPENWVHYINRNDGITVDALVKGGREEVMNFVYEPNSSQKSLRCDAQLF